MKITVLSFAIFALASLGPTQAQTPAAPVKAQTAPLRWVFQMHRDPEINPHTNVFLRVGSRQILVMRQVHEEFRPATKTDYKIASVPPHALTACLGWWADMGEYLYVSQRGRLLVVYRKRVDEQGPFSSWTRLKVIPLR